MGVVNVKNPDGTYTAYAPGTEPSPIPAAGQVNPNGQAPGSFGQPIKRTVDTSVVPTPAVPAVANDPSTAEGFLNRFTPPKTADQIAEEMRKSSASLIDSIQKTYDDKVSAEQDAGEERLDQNNAIDIVSGLMGSTEAAASRSKVSDANQKAVDAINNERGLKLAEVFRKISEDAKNEARLQLQDATANAKDVVARREKTQTDSVNNLKLMASTGLVDYDAFSTNPKNQEVYKHALEAVGGSEDALRGLFLVNRPKDQIVGTPTRIGDSYVQAYSNPITGKVSYESIKLPVDLPKNYSHFERIGKDNNTLIAIPDNWSGDMKDVKTIYAGGSAGTGGAGSSEDFAQTIELAGQNASSVYAQKALKDQLRAAISAKDYPSAYQGIVQATSQGLSGENKTKFENAAIDQTLLRNMAVKLQAFKDAGGDMNIFKGKADDIGKRIGVLATDPRYATIATELDRAFQQYRQNMTGAAFSPQESAEYSKVVPGKNNSIDLNLTTIQGALNYANNYVEGAIRTKTGEGGVYIKQYAEGAKPADASASGDDIASQVAAQGYDYTQMKADGHSDEEIRAALGL